MSVRSRLIRTLVFTDLVAILLLMILSLMFVSGLGEEFGTPFVGVGSVGVLLLIPIVSLAANLIVDSYRADLALTGVEFYVRVLKANFVTFATIATFGTVFDVRATRAFVLFGIPIGIVLQVLSRRVARQIIFNALARPQNQWKTLVVGDKSSSLSLPNFIRVVGVRSMDDLSSNWKEFHTDSVDSILVLDASSMGTTGFRDLCWQADDRNVIVWLVTQNQIIASGRTSVLPFHRNNVLSVNTVHLSMPSRVLKRVFDIVLSALLLLAIAPLLAIIGLVIRVVDGGPIVFKQKRVGLDGRTFVIYKIRTMVNESRESTPIDVPWDMPGTKWNQQGRITKTGRFLRVWSLDELPQLFNVLGGSMSLVGPRPRLPEEMPDVPETFRRLRARPGMTGLWQVAGRADLSFSDADALDIQYVDSWSFSLDIAILSRTLKAVVSRQGAK